MCMKYELIWIYFRAQTWNLSANLDCFAPKPYLKTAKAQFFFDQNDCWVEIIKGETQVEIFSFWLFLTIFESFRIFWPVFGVFLTVLIIFEWFWTIFFFTFIAFCLWLWPLLTIWRFFWPYWMYRPFLTVYRFRWIDGWKNRKYTLMDVHEVQKVYIEGWLTTNDGWKYRTRHFQWEIFTRHFDRHFYETYWWPLKNFDAL